MTMSVNQAPGFQLFDCFAIFISTISAVTVLRVFHSLCYAVLLPM